MSHETTQNTYREKLNSWQARVAIGLTVLGLGGAGYAVHESRETAENPSAENPSAEAAQSHRPLANVQQDIMVTATCAATGMTVQSNGDMRVSVRIDASGDLLAERQAADADTASSKAATLPYEYRAAVVTDSTAKEADSWLEGTDQAPVTPPQFSQETTSVENGVIVPHPGTIDGTTIVTGVILKSSIPMEGAPSGPSRILQCAGALTFDSTKNTWAFNSETPAGLEYAITCGERDDYTVGWQIEPINC